MSTAVAVTGASGFVGQALVAHLLASGRSVRALVHRQSLAMNHPALATVPGSLSDDAALDRLMAGACGVIHVAGRVRGRDEADFLPVNAEGAARVARAACAAQTVTRLVLISSLAAREPGLSPYAASKRAGETRLAEEVARGGNLGCAVLRPPAIYGPGDQELLPLLRLMSRGVVPMPGVAGARASLLHVHDLARAALCLLDSPAQGTFELHDGHEAGYGWDEIATIVESVAGRGRGWRLRLPEAMLRSVATVNLRAARLFGYLPMMTPGKVNELRHPDWVCDNTELTRATGWQPEISLHDGLCPLLGATPVKPREGRSNAT